MLLGTIKEMTENPPTILFPYVKITMQHPLQKHKHLVVVFQLGLQTIVHHGIQSLWFASLDTTINSAYFASLAHHILANITSIKIYHFIIKNKLRCVNIHMLCHGPARLATKKWFTCTCTTVFHMHTQKNTMWKICYSE